MCNSFALDRSGPVRGRSSSSASARLAGYSRVKILDPVRLTKSKERTIRSLSSGNVARLVLKLPTGLTSLCRSGIEERLPRRLLSDLFCRVRRASFLTIWPERQIVGGRDVLAPSVLLAESSREREATTAQISRCAQSRTPSGQQLNAEWARSCALWSDRYRLLHHVPHTH